MDAAIDRSPPRLLKRAPVKRPTLPAALSARYSLFPMLSPLGRARQEAFPSIGSTVAGILFGVSWLLWIDAISFSAKEYNQAVDGAYWIPGILQTISLFMINFIHQLLVLFLQIMKSL